MRAAFLVLALASRVSAQTPPESPTFHTGAREVLVDANVTDKQGSFQRDLDRSDFHLFEDGKEQPISSFALESALPTGIRNPHFIALVVEAEQPGLRDQLLDFIEHYSAPDLYLALYSRVGTEMRLQAPFTTDTERLKAAARNMPSITTPPFLGRTIERIPVFDRVSRVAADIEPVHGHKALVLFSYGFFATWYTMPNSSAQPSLPGAGLPASTPFGRDIQNVTDACNKAGVSVFAFALGKNAGQAAGDFYNTSGSRIGGSTDFFRDLAVGTGGRYTPPGTYDLGRYLGSVIHEQSDYYLLGYSPASDADGKPCHKIRVKVDRPGLDVKARDEYCSSAVPRGLKAPHRALEARLAGAVPRPQADAMQLSWFRFKPSAALVAVDADIDPAAMKRRGRSNLELNVLGIAYREDGSAALRIPDAVNLEFGSPAERDEFLKKPYHYTSQFTLPPGRYRFVFTAGSEEQTFSVAEKPLEIEPWSAPSISLSSLVLGRKDHAAAAVDSELDPSLTDSAHRLLSKGRELEATGSTQFPAGHDSMFYFEIYSPSSAPPLALTVRIVDRGGEEQANSGPLDVAQWVESGRTVIPIALTLPFAKMTPGDYTLEVRVNGSDQNASVRAAAFSVKSPR